MAVVLQWLLVAAPHAMIVSRDNNAEGIVFRKRRNIREMFIGSFRPCKSVLETYSRNFRKSVFDRKFSIFVVIFS